MLNHISIGVTDLEASARFYDATLAPLGYARLSDSPGSIGYGAAGNAAFWVIEVKSPVPRDPNSGLHICFDAPSRESVDAFHRTGVSAGGEDNGPPGIRAEYNPQYYAAFVIDPDGYRIEAYHKGD